MGIDVVAKAKRVRIYVGEQDLVGHTPVALAVLELLRRERAMGATVIRASGGFGASGEIHAAHLVDVAPHLPVVIEWIDRAEIVERVLPRVVAMVAHGLVTVDDTDIVRFEPHPVRDVPAGVTAADVMSRDVTCVARDTPLRGVVEAMLGQVYRAVPVVDGGAPVGIVTNGDLVRKGGLGVRLELMGSLDERDARAELERLSVGGRVAGDVMTSPAVTVAASTPLPEVAAVMSRGRLKRLPVVDGAGKLVGVVSRLDVLRAAAGGVDGKAALPREMVLARDAPLSRVMRTDVPLVHPDTPLAEVFQAVVATRLNRALVVDAGRHVVGLVTDAELLDRVTPALRRSALRSLMNRLPFAHAEPAAAAAQQHARARTAGDLMSRGVPVAREETLLGDAIAVMLKGGHKVLAVTDGSGRLVGIVDRADLLHALAPP